MNTYLYLLIYKLMPNRLNVKLNLGFGFFRLRLDSPIELDSSQAARVRNFGFGFVGVTPRHFEAIVLGDYRDDFLLSEVNRFALGGGLDGGLGGHVNNIQPDARECKGLFQCRRVSSK